ncbi:MAG: ATP-binding protein [Nanoarchaeota archaeon]
MHFDATEQIERFKEFFSYNYEDSLHHLASRGINVLKVDFAQLAKFDPEIADQLLEEPEDIIRAAELAIDNFDLQLKNFRVRFYNLPRDQFVFIRDIRSTHLNKFMTIEGIVRQSSDVRPQVTSAKFECPSCGNTITILQLDSRFKEPSRCSCGRRGRFRLVSKDLVDAQRLVLEEIPESLQGGEQPKRLSVFLKEDLVEPKMEKKTTPGSKVIVYGIVKEVPIFLRTGAQSIRYDLMVEANNIEAIEKSFGEYELDDLDEKEIKKLSQDPKIFEKLTKSIAPSIYGHEKIKEALVLQLMGGVRKFKEDGTTTRGDIHILLVGDPGSGKSQMLTFISKAAPKSRLVSGKGASLDYNEPLLIRKNNFLDLVKIGEFVDKNCNGLDEVFVNLDSEDIKALSLNLKTKKIEWRTIKSVYRHKNKDKLLNFTLETGRQVRVTKDHSIFVLENGNTIHKNAADLKRGDCVLIPSKMPSEEKNAIDPDFARLVGYYIAEGHLINKDGSYKIEFTLNNNEDFILKDIKFLSNKFLNQEAKSYKHGENGIRVTVYGKDAYYRFVDVLGKVAHKRAKDKRIPLLILNSNHDARSEFIKGYILGDSGVTKSKGLMSDLLYLYLQDRIIASCSMRLDKNEKKNLINGREIKKEGLIYDLKSPNPKKIYKNRYKNPPFESLSKLLCDTFLKTIISSDYSRANENRLGNNNFLTRLNFISNEIFATGGELRTKFGDSILEYLGENSDYFTKIRQGRECLVALSEKGKLLFDELIRFRTLMQGDLGFTRIKKIEEVESSSEYVYDISIPENENFVAGFGGIICHNTGAGLTATVVKDEFLRGWALEAGALVLANGGIAVIDELDKMNPEDRDALHEALEQQRISISKANIQATLRAETTVLAAANPKLGRFDPYAPIASQIDLPPTLINRFDLIFPIRDLPNKELDEKIASHVLNLQQNPDDIKTEISGELLKKYLSYTKQKVFPHLTNEAIEEIKSFYVGLRNSGQKGEDEIRPIPISARQLEALVRLAEASARTKLSDKVTREDAKRGIELLKYCLMQVGYDYETGQIDIDRITTGVPASQRSKIVAVREIIKKLENKVGKMIPIADIIIEASAQNVNESQVEEIIEQLKREAEVFEPKRGFVSRL